VNSSFFFLKRQFLLRPLCQVHFLHDPDQLYGIAHFEHKSPAVFHVTVNMDFIQSEEELNRELKCF